MNKDQFARLARLARHRKVQQVLTDHATAVAAVPAFARLAADYLRQLGLLDGTARRTGAPAEGATLAKSTAGTALIARLVKAANALYLVYKAEKPANLAEATQLHRRASDYVNMGDQALATEATELVKRTAAHKDILQAEYNWDAATLKALADDAKSFTAQLTAPQLAIDAAKIKGATAKATLSTLNVFLKDDLRAGMELLKDTHADAYNALREASQVDDARRGKGKGQTVAQNKGTLLPPAVVLVFALLGLLGSLCPQKAWAQAEEVLKSRKVSTKINVSYFPLKDNKIEFVTDKDYRNPDSKKLVSPMSVVATDGSYKILTRFVNPLNYTVHISQLANVDPQVEEVNGFLASITQLFGQMGAAQFIKGTTAEKATVDKVLQAVREGEKSNFTDLQSVAPGAETPSTAEKAMGIVKSATGRLRSQEALNLSLWLYTGNKTVTITQPQKKPVKVVEGCFEKNYRDAVLANVVAIEDKLYGFPDSAKQLVHALTVPQTYQLLKAELPVFDKMVAKLKYNVSSSKHFIGLLDKIDRPAVEVVRSPTLTTKSTPLTQCDNLIYYTNNLLDNYSSRVAEQIKVREALLTRIDGMISEIRKEMDSADKNQQDDDYFVEKGYVESEEGKIKIVDIRVVQNTIQFESDNSTVSVSKRELLSSSLKVRPYSTLVAEVGVGVVFTNLYFPKYAAKTLAPGSQVVESAGVDRVSVIPVTVLNIYPAAFHSTIYPLLQLGMGTGQGRPTIFLGGGLRFLRPFNRVTITGGAVWTWRRDLNDLAVGDVVTGDADIEKDLTYQFRDIPRPYLGVQYNF